MSVSRVFMMFATLGVAGFVACTPTLAQTATSSQTKVASDIQLDYPNAPTAKVEMSASAGLFSDLFGITEPNAKMRVYRILKKMKKFINLKE